MNTWDCFSSVRKDGLTLILGLGETGVAAARWCAAAGASLRVLDTRSRPPGLPALQDLGQSVDYHLGADRLDVAALEGVHTLVLSPGLNPRLPQHHAFLAAARARQVEILGEVELFARALSAMATQGYRPLVLAVTGTNGKTTVTALTRRLVAQGDRKVRAAGNISPAALASLHEALVQDDLPDVWVLELSSFQLETTTSLQADAAVVLNVSQDHLDWHGSMQAYADAKARLLTLARIAIVNRDDARVRAMVRDLGAPQVRSFGADAPTLAGDLGLVSFADHPWLARVPDAADAPDTARAVQAVTGAQVPGQRAPGRPEALMPAGALRIRGLHNALNAQAALALGFVAGLSLDDMLEGLRAYAGEAHRTEWVRVIDEIAFIDDSKGTNVAATVAALQSMERRTVLIAGGLGKGQDFTPLVAAARANARAVLLIGQDAPRIAQALEGSGVPFESCASLEAAVVRGHALAKAGDAVLLSPACASMDMFRNYRHRSACFVQAVQALARDRGEVA